MTSHFIQDNTVIKMIDNENICLACKFDINFYQDVLFDELNIKFPDILSKAVPKRKAEFLAGRFIVQQAMKILRQPIVDIPIGKNRSPQWPQGIIGSISHSGERAFCLLTRVHTRKSTRLGIDYEQYITEHLVAGIQGSILNDEEAKLCRRSAYDFNKALTLVFSAKESLFKALYPSVNRYFDFLDASVTAFKIKSNTKDFNNETFILTLRLNTDLNTKLHEGKCFSISYQWVNKGVLTFLIDKD